jgi:hypothetical protein
MFRKTANSVKIFVLPHQRARTCTPTTLTLSYLALPHHGPLFPAGFILLLLLLYSSPLFYFFFLVVVGSKEVSQVSK